MSHTLVNRPTAVQTQVLGYADDRRQGLAAYVCTRSLGRSMRGARRLEAGMVAVNRDRVSSVAAPFGGVTRSGHGCSGGSEGIAEYPVTRYITLPEA